MKQWLNVFFILCAALTLFGAGLTLGQLGWSPQIVAAHPWLPDPLDGGDGFGGDGFGGDGGFLTWQQNEGQLKISVGGPDPTYIGLAKLEDENAWLEHGEGEVLYTPEVVVLDLAPVESMTLFRLVPIGSLEEGFFLPCNDPVARCFPIRPPLDPPRPGQHWFVPGADRQLQ